MLPIVDTHQHLWDLEKFNLPWLEGAPSLNHSHITADYLAATQGSNVIKAVYMEVDVIPERRVAEAEYVTALCEQEDNPTCGAVISGSPGQADFEEYINQFRGNSYIKGIRQVLHTPKCPQGYCLDDAFVASVQLLGELGLSFDICIRPGELADGVTLAQLCPDTTLILDHCGNADPNIVANDIHKISGIVARTQAGWQPQDLAPTIDYCLDSFGPDRVVFGGDWPVCTLGASYIEWSSALRTIIVTRSEMDQRKLLHDNAVRIYRLD